MPAKRRGSPRMRCEPPGTAPFPIERSLLASGVITAVRSGAIGRTVLTSGAITDPLTQVKGLNAEGGWSQLKFQQTAKLEWNGAIGMDTVPAKDLHSLPFFPTSYGYSPIARNRSGILNFIYRPRSDLLVSGEFHPLRTFTVRGNTYKSNQVSLSMGVLF
jgi:hypothetical protein